MKTLLYPLIVPALLLIGVDGAIPSSGETAAPATQPAATQPSAATAQVGIDNFSFKPATITVTAGATVTWTNHDDVPHTVTSNDKQLFASPALDTDEKFSRKFDTPGEYPYYCTVHPHMTGKVIVK